MTSPYGFLGAILTPALIACHSPGPTPVNPAPTAAGQAEPPSKEAKAANATSDPSAPAPANVPPSSPAPVAFPCANLTCYRFETARAALAFAREKSKATFLGFGEAHTPSSFTGHSTVFRFQHELLPELAATKGGLVLEILKPPSGCSKDTAIVRKEGETVTEGQKETNQNEYVALGNAAYENGLRVDLLHPSCADMKAIADAGELGIVVMMETIARLTAASGQAFRALKGPEAAFFSYGGALHNDSAPRETRSAWSYGPAFTALTNGAYLEVDLVVPELISDTSAWKSFDFYEATQQLPGKNGPDGYFLIERGPGSIALLWPRSGEPSEKPAQ